VTKIVIIGAGSTSFGPTTLATLLREPKLRGSELALVDTNEATLALVANVAEKMNDAWGAEMAIQATTERKEALHGADFVVVSIEVSPREKLWRLDWEVTLKHGLRQPYGENGGPGGLMHACRQIPPFMEIVRDMEMLCPDAWLINFSNPLPRITRAVTKYSRIKTVGKCHQIGVGYSMVGVLLRERYGLDIPAGFNCHSDPGNIETKHAVAQAARQHVAIKSAGLNHFIWLLDVRDRHTGEDLYPALRAALPQVPDSLDLLSMELFRIFGYLPIAGDTHLVEYLPWLHDPLTRPWEQYQIPLYDWEDNEARREALYHMLAEMAAGGRAVDELKGVHSEGAAELITAVSRDENYYDETVNIPNRGAIGNLPAEAIVEVPGLVSGWGVRGVQVGDLPQPIAALCRREVDLVEMVVETAVTGDRYLALQTLLLDPMINDIGRARAILDDYLHTFADVLPQF
jgi:alpha-galactosidase